jgi:hypothetical protein
LTPEEKATIDTMTRLELCRRWRFSPIGDDFWQGEKGKYATERLTTLGGFSPEISKSIGWDSME